LKQVNIDTWNRKELYNHFKDFADPYFAVIIPFDVTNAYKNAKTIKYSFFSRYLHDCMKALNDISNLKYRIQDDSVIDYNTIHASATLMRQDKTFGFSFIKYDESLAIFLKHIEEEQTRIENSKNLYPDEEYRLDCIHCSAMPWVNFTGHKEPVSGTKDSIPKLAFGKTERVNGKLMMNVSIHVNHALVDGYHIGLFAEKYQKYLNSNVML